MSLDEEGEAVSGPDGLSWIYTTIEVNENLSGNKITVTPTDPEKSAQQEIACLYQFPSPIAYSGILVIHSSSR
ncbi:MAG: hypothetical protein PHI28_01610 [Mangrovibacterium sp.]|nr:hypothetical protein [Mangrovibacterium sp.]